MDVDSRRCRRGPSLKFIIPEGMERKRKRARWVRRDVVGMAYWDFLASERFTNKP
jgi:hypothetical protein